jgi:hypothetical protein
MVRLYFSGKLSGNQVLRRVIAAAALLSLFAVSTLATPDQIPMPECRFKMLTGYSCPSCGMTHSFHAFAIGRPGMAFHYNWMGPFLFIMLLLLLLKVSVELLTNKKTGIDCPKILPRIVLLLIPGLWLTFWSVRFSHEFKNSRAVGPEPPQTRKACNILVAGGYKAPKLQIAGRSSCPADPQESSKQTK